MTGADEIVAYDAHRIDFNDLRYASQQPLMSNTLCTRATGHRQPD